MPLVGMAKKLDPGMIISIEQMMSKACLVKSHFGRSMEKEFDCDPSFLGDVLQTINRLSKNPPLSTSRSVMSLSSM